MCDGQFIKSRPQSIAFDPSCQVLVSLLNAPWGRGQLACHLPLVHHPRKLAALVRACVRIHGTGSRCCSPPTSVLNRLGVTHVQLEHSATTGSRQQGSHQHREVRYGADLGSIRRVNARFSSISKDGAFSIDSLYTRTASKEVIDEFDGPEFRAVAAGRFGVDFTGRPKM